MSAWNVAERRLGFPYPLWSPGSLLRLSQEVARSDLVHLHDNLYLGNFITYLVARRAKKPVVVTQHVGAVPYRSPCLRSLLGVANRTIGRIVLGGASQVVFVSPRVQDYFLRFVHFGRTPRWVSNGLERTMFYPVAAAERNSLRWARRWPDGQPVFLFAGRFVEKKGLPILRRLAQEFPECHWVLVGWGPEDPRRWGLANVECHDVMDHRALSEYYRAADFFVIPSTGEGFPLVVQEALACGTPAILSAETAEGMPGIDLVCRTADAHWEDFAKTIRKILGERTNWGTWRQCVAAFAAEHWDWERCTKQYEVLFRALIEPKNR